MGDLKVAREVQTKRTLWVCAKDIANLGGIKTAESNEQLLLGVGTSIGEVRICYACANHGSASLGPIWVQYERHLTLVRPGPDENGVCHWKRFYEVWESSSAKTHFQRQLDEQMTHENTPRQAVIFPQNQRP